MYYVLRVTRSVLDFVRDTRGLTTVEYAVAGGLIATALILAFIFLSGVVANEVNTIGQTIESN